MKTRGFREIPLRPSSLARNIRIREIDSSLVRKLAAPSIKQRVSCPPDWPGFLMPLPGPGVFASFILRSAMRIHLHPKAARQRGAFTLIELLVVMAIIAILIGLLL